MGEHGRFRSRLGGDHLVPEGKGAERLEHHEVGTAGGDGLGRLKEPILAAHILGGVEPLKREGTVELQNRIQAGVVR